MKGQNLSSKQIHEKIKKTAISYDGVQQLLLVTQIRGQVRATRMGQGGENLISHMCSASPQFLALVENGLDMYKARIANVPEIKQISDDVIQVTLPAKADDGVELIEPEET